MPSLDFISRWQRYEDQHFSQVQELMKRHYYFNPLIQSALQFYGEFDSEAKAREYAEKHALSVGVDITMGPSGKWIVLRDDEQTLDKTVYVGDENEYVQGLIAQMKKEGKIGEDMLKKRIERQHNQHPESFKDINGELPSVMPQLQSLNAEFKQKRLELASASGISEVSDKQEDLIKDLHDVMPILIPQKNGGFQQLNI